MHLLVSLVMMMSALTPTRVWYAPDQPILIDVKAGREVSLVLTELSGKMVESKGATKVADGKQVDLRQLFPLMNSATGAYILYAVLPDEDESKFIGTPLVLTVRHDPRRAPPHMPMVTKVEPLQYASVKTSEGEVVIAFYYDVAPHTVDNFIKLAEEGFYNGLNFHRIVPNFVIQTGDPVGDSTGGPGYQIQAEFNDRPHEAGVVSMSRASDPMERSGAMPRPEFANSGGSQFFICLDYKNTRQLDGRYTAFGKVITGMDVAKKIAQKKPAEGSTAKPPVVEKIEIKPVVAQDNPYPMLFSPDLPATMPTTVPSE
jgi:cyclophilin family peptidyl-prolyl cis-trans isomerase